MYEKGCAEIWRKKWYEASKTELNSRKFGDLPNSRQEQDEGKRSRAKIEQMLTHKEKSVCKRGKMSKVERSISEGETKQMYETGCAEI